MNTTNPPAPASAVHVGKERPILFSGPMVRALLNSSKTQTRRVCKHAMDTNLSAVVGPFDCPEFGSGWFGDEDGDVQFLGPYGQPGDRLWVRETFMDLNSTGVEHRDSTGRRQRYAFAADTPPGSYGDEARKEYGLKWKPSIHMPRAASRILLEIVSVRVERLQDISEADAIAEGCTRPVCGPDWKLTKRWAYRTLWESINGAGSWAANPWVWVVEFKRANCAIARGLKE
jgi:hypothetical protein